MCVCSLLVGAVTKLHLAAWLICCCRCCWCCCCCYTLVSSDYVALSVISCLPIYNCAGAFKRQFILYSYTTYYLFNTFIINLFMWAAAHTNSNGIVYNMAIYKTNITNQFWRSSLWHARKYTYICMYITIKRRRKREKKTKNFLYDLAIVDYVAYIRTCFV